jgi:hypothetical protein
VEVGGAGPETRQGIQALHGVDRVVIASQAGDITTFDVTVSSGASADVQRAVTRFAVDAGLTLISNSEETLDLETVFLRLIDQKEVAA